MYIVVITYENLNWVIYDPYEPSRGWVINGYDTILLMLYNDDILFGCIRYKIT